MSNEENDKDKLSRLKAMVEKNSKWDLSDNDIIAIKYAIKQIEEFTKSFSLGLSEGEILGHKNGLNAGKILGKAEGWEVGRSDERKRIVGIIEAELNKVRPQDYENTVECSLLRRLKNQIEV